MEWGISVIVGEEAAVLNCPLDNTWWVEIPSGVLCRPPTPLRISTDGGVHL